MRTARPYQEKIINDLRAAMRNHRRVLVCSPTGSGKTFLATTIADGAARKGRRVIFIVHRSELLDQTSAAFRDNGVDHGIVVAGKSTPDNHVLVAMEMTLANRLGDINTPDILFDDECHRAVSRTRMRIAESWRDAWSIGLTATPCRTDGRGLRERYDTMVMGPSVHDMIAGGWLAEYDAYTPWTPDLSDVEPLDGDYPSDQIGTYMSRPTITGSIIEHYQRLGDGKRAIGFGASVTHSAMMAQAFRAAGVPAIHLDGVTPANLRRQAIADFRSGAVRVLFNWGLFVEGFDVPDAEVLIGARPTSSLSVHLQMVGRILRPKASGAHAIIIDHAGNLARHGFPDDPRSWSLDGVIKRPAGEALAPGQECPRCFAFHRPAPTCPRCGYVYPTAPTDAGPRTIGGELVRARRKRGEDPIAWAGGIDLAMARGREWHALIAQAEGDIERLRMIMRARGYKRGWAKHQQEAWFERNGGTA